MHEGWSEAPGGRIDVGSNFSDYNRSKIGRWSVRREVASPLPNLLVSKSDILSFVEAFRLKEKIGKNRKRKVFRF